MTVSKLIFCAFAAASLAGCAQTSLNGDVATRNSVNHSMPATPTAQTGAQSAALGQMMDKLVRNSTRKGILSGAAVGCGLVLVSAGNAKSCATGALTGAAVGGNIGNQKGKRDVARRVEMVSANELTRTLRASNDQLDDLRIGLRETLAAQDSELADMRQRRQNGSLSDADYTARMTEIQSFRRELAEALTLHQRQADQATANLETASQQGQTGLDWHMSATRQLSRDVASARSEITLL